MPTNRQRSAPPALAAGPGAGSSYVSLSSGRPGRSCIPCECPEHGRGNTPAARGAHTTRTPPAKHRRPTGRSTGVHAHHRHAIAGSGSPPVGWPAGPAPTLGAPPAAGPRPCRRRRRKNHRSSSSTSGTAFPRRTLRVHLVPRHGGDSGLPRRRRAGRRDRHPRTEMDAAGAGHRGRALARRMLIRRLRRTHKRRGHRPDERASQTRTQSTTMDCSAQDPSGGPAHPPTATLSTGV